jgi:hypothetical protein
MKWRPTQQQGHERTKRKDLDNPQRSQPTSAYVAVEAAASLPFPVCPTTHHTIETKATIPYSSLPS